METSGNGSIMRLAPVAMYFHDEPNLLLHAAELSSRTTHASEECLASCRYLAAVLHCCLSGASGKDAVLAWASKLELPPNMARIREQRFRSVGADEVRGTGYVTECLEAALWCFWHTNTYEDAVLAAANLGDDADTTAAVCGQIAGAYYGLRAIPARWLEELHGREKIERISSDLVPPKYRHLHSRPDAPGDPSLVQR